MIYVLLNLLIRPLYLLISCLWYFFGLHPHHSRVYLRQTSTTPLSTLWFSQVDNLVDLLESYSDVIAILMTLPLVQYAIDTSDCHPVRTATLSHLCASIYFTHASPFYLLQGQEPRSYRLTQRCTSTAVGLILNRKFAPRSFLVHTSLPLNLPKSIIMTDIPIFFLIKLVVGFGWKLVLLLPANL